MESPWLAGRAGLGDTNARMTMFGLHFRYGIEKKYADLFKDFKVTACFWNSVQQIADIEGLAAQRADLLFIDPASEAAGGDCQGPLFGCRHSDYG